MLGLTYMCAGSYQAPIITSHAHESRDFSGEYSNYAGLLRDSSRSQSNMTAVDTLLQRSATPLQRRLRDPVPNPSPQAHA